MAPEMFALFRCHWYVSGAVPAAATVKVAVAPAVTIAFAGCVVMDGAAAAELTVSVAAVLVALPALFVTTHRNEAPLSAEVVAGVVYEALVAPEMFALFRCHWYASGAVPVAATVKVAVAPAVTVAFAGCVVIDGATADELTVRVAVFEVAAPALFVTTHRNVAPLSAEVVAGVV